MITVILPVLCSTSIAQRILSTSSEPAFKNAVAFYNNSFGPDLHLFSGKEYLDYNFRFSQGHPYFQTTTFSKGTITYQGSTYEEVPMLYNLETDNVIILNHSGTAKIQLIKEKVSSFSLSGHSFINICNDSLLSQGLRYGFYDILATGKTTLLARRTKNIQIVAQDIVEIKVLAKDYFYLQNNNIYSVIRSKKGLLNLLSDRKKEIRQFVKQNNIDYRENPENAIVRIVEYYNQIMK